MIRGPGGPRRRTAMKRAISSGQQMIEYLLLLVAVIAAILVLIRPHGLFQDRIEHAINCAISPLELDEAVTEAACQ